MSLLGVLHLLLVGAGLLGQIRRPIALRNFAARRRQRRPRQRGRVGTHVGDEPVLVQALGDRHRLSRTEAQLAAGLLLQRRGHERRVGAAGIGLGLDRGHRGRSIGEGAGQGCGGPLVEHQRTLSGQLAFGVEIAAGGQAHAVHLDHLGAKVGRLASRWRSGAAVSAGDVHLCLQVPIRRRAERHAGPLALDDDAGGHRLHPAGRQTGHHLLPQNRRHLIAIQAVEDPPGLLGIDHAAVEIPRVVDRGLDGVGGDLVKHHAPYRHLGAEHLEQVPCNRLALAILIRCQIELVCVGQQALQVLHLGLLVSSDHV